MQTIWIAILAVSLFLFGRGFGRLHLGKYQPEPLTFDTHTLTFDRTCRKCRKLESALLEVRTHQIRNAALPDDWKEITLQGTDFEFAFMVCTSVWGSFGEQYYQHRLAMFAGNPVVYWGIRDLVAANQKSVRA